MQAPQIDAIPVILAGGSGTRLWPMSRTGYPKQFIALGADSSLLQQTVRRASSTFSRAPILVGNESHRFMVAEQCRTEHVEPAAILLEPLGRSTAPAIAVAAWHSLSVDDDALLVVLPSDHLLDDLAGFQESMHKAAAAANQGYLVAFGVQPAYPEPGYGYLEAGARIADSDVSHVTRFVEKPDVDSAKELLKNAQCFWNSGMFVFRASEYLNALKNEQPEIYRLSRSALDRGHADLDFFRLDGDSYSKMPSVSVDYAIMERSTNIAVVELSTNWSDVGSWEGVYRSAPKDENLNVLSGDIVAVDTSDCYINATSRLVATIGLSGLAIIETTDCVLVSTLSRSQDTRIVVDRLNQSARPEVDTHSVVFRPWGHYETLNLDTRYQVKRITVKPGAKLSMQKHYHRAEHWIVVRGTARITNGDEHILLSENQSTYIPLGNWHRLENPGKVPLELIEVQSGAYLGEDDIERSDDMYGRNIDVEN